MSRSLRNALIASMESDDIELMNPLTDQQETNIDEVLLEINEGAEEVQQADEVVEVLEDAEESMEALAASLEAHIAEGGMSPQTARTHNVAMSIALRGLPINVDRVTVSSESFGGHGDKLSASMEALEGVKETLKKLWEGIKNAIKNAWAAVTNFVATLRKSAPVIAAAAAKLKVRAEALKGAKLKGDGKMDAVAAAKAFHVGGKFDGDVAGALRKIENGVSGVDKSSKAGAIELRKIAGKITSGTFDPVADYTALGKAIMAPISTDEMPGGYKIEINDKGVQTLVSSSKFEGSASISVPDISDVILIANNAKAVANMMNEYTAKSYAALEKTVSQFIKETGAGVDKVAAGDKEKAANMRKALAGANKMTSVARGCGPQYIRYAAGAAKMAMAFGGAVLKQYGEKKEA